MQWKQQGIPLLESVSVGRRKAIRRSLLFAAMIALPLVAVASAIEILYEGQWEEKNYAVEGSWSIISEVEGDSILLHADFSTRKGPDLKVFLSPLSLDEVGDRNATRESLEVGVLEQFRGKQRFALPDDIDLDGFQSILIHCEKYSKLWAAGGLVPR